MANPVSNQRFEFIGEKEANRAKTAHAAAVANYEGKIDRAVKVGEYAQAAAPVLLTHALAIAVLSYLRVFALLSFLNCRVTTYAVPAVTSCAANALAEKVQPVMNTVGRAAGCVAENAMRAATVSQYDTYIAAK